MTLERLQDILDRVTYPGHWFVAGTIGAGYYLQIQYSEADIATGLMEVQHGRKWYVSDFATDSEILQTTLKAALTSAEHRVREHFLVDNVRVFGPHMSIDNLIKFVKANEEHTR